MAFFQEAQSDRLAWPLTETQVEALDSMVATLFKRVRALEVAATAATATLTTVATVAATAAPGLAGFVSRDGEDGDIGPRGPAGVPGPPGPDGYSRPGQDGDDADNWMRGTTGPSPLSGLKVYFVADTSGGAVTRKLTFNDGVLISET